MSDDHPPHSLDDLDARLRKARERGAPGPTQGPKVANLPGNALGMAFRIGVDLVAAMILGVGGGLLLDRWLGTAPWGLVAMFFAGAAAGILNVYRAVNGLGYGAGYRRDDNDATPASGRNDATPASGRNGIPPASRRDNENTPATGGDHAPDRNGDDD